MPLEGEELEAFLLKQKEGKLAAEAAKKYMLTYALCLVICLKYWGYWRRGSFFFNSFQWCLASTMHDNAWKLTWAMWWWAAALCLYCCEKGGVGGGGGWCTHRPFAKAPPPIIMSVCSTLSSNVQLLHLGEGGCT